MTRPKLEWRESALVDLEELMDAIAADNPLAALALQEEIEAKVTVLVRQPRLYARSQRAPGYRQLTIRPNYIVLYRLLPDERAPQTIDLAAVVHARREKL